MERSGDSEIKLQIKPRETPTLAPEPANLNASRVTSSSCLSLLLKSTVWRCPKSLPKKLRGLLSA